MPDGVRACACELLEVVLRDGAAFAAFATPQPTTADSAIAQVALALSARLSGSSVDAPLPLQRVEPHEAQQQRQQQHKQRSSRHASSRVNENDDGAGIVSSSGRAAAVPFPHGASSECRPRRHARGHPPRDEETRGGTRPPAISDPRPNRRNGTSVEAASGRPIARSVPSLVPI